MIIQDHIWSCNNKWFVLVMIFVLQVVRTSFPWHLPMLPICRPSIWRLEDARASCWFVIIHTSPFRAFPSQLAARTDEQCVRTYFRCRRFVCEKEKPRLGNIQDFYGGWFQKRLSKLGLFIRPEWCKVDFPGFQIRHIKWTLALVFVCPISPAH